ncbi:GNAT family N-acetyltransferase [Microbacterium xanthum]|uniref:GNAT family N-acetyltransferase n=1 Tax=Microbacterium xanthum TaxID=3079794 RepID=UPI002AD49A7A|nr:N-acetyltransferase family protein [Microbacterium sp. KSW-48]MDZ8171859.1 N-acetyltransferase family protein [Microbacterium sp. KSW-48]
MAPADWTAVREIYAEAIAEGESTFEAATPTWEEFVAGKLSTGRLVAIDPADGAVLGWVAASPVSSRVAYAGVVEHSVYVSSRARGRGIGRLLLEAFLDASEAAGVWTVQSSVFPENTVSLRLHESVGFRVVGRRERIARGAAGERAGLWRDTLLIERRSVTVGVDDG